MNDEKQDVRLVDRLGQVFASIDGGDEVPVRVVWARPLTAHGDAVGLVTSEKEEVATLDSLDDLDPDSRRVAESALSERYLMAKVERVNSTDPHFGNRYFDVETDRGPAKFILKDPNRNVTHVTPDHIILRDTQGNRYEIAFLAGLDARSRANIDKVI